MYDAKQFTYDAALLGQVSVMLAVLKEQKDAGEFANARIVRNLVQQSIFRMARRVEGRLDAPGALTQVTASDLPLQQVFGCPAANVDFSQFRWKDSSGNILSIEQLPLAGAFPELTAESLELCRGIAKLRKLEHLEEAEEDLEALEQRVAERAAAVSPPAAPMKPPV
jgi:hypothetical protein